MAVAEVGSRTTNTASGSTTLTISHTTTAATDLLVVCAFAWGDTNPPTATWDGNAMARQVTIGVSSVVTVVFTYVNPGNKTANVVITWGDTNNSGGTAVNCSGANTTTPVEDTDTDSSADAATQSITLASQSGGLCFDQFVVQHNYDDPTITGGQSELSDLDPGGNVVRGGASKEAGAASVTTSWSVGTSDPVALCGIAVAPAAAAATPQTVVEITHTFA